MYKIVIAIAALLLVSTLVDAQNPTQEPLNNINSYFASSLEAESSGYDTVLYLISSDAPYKVDFCATNDNNQLVQLFISASRGRPDEPDMLVHVSSKDTRCIHFGGSADDAFQLRFGGQGNPHDVIYTRSLITTHTTPSGTATVELCESGEKGPFNCQPLP